MRIVEAINNLRMDFPSLLKTPTLASPSRTDVLPDCSVAVGAFLSFRGRSLYRPLAWRRVRTFQHFNLAVVMDVLGDLDEIAHIEPPRTDRALFEVIGLGLSDAVAIGTGVPRK